MKKVIWTDTRGYKRVSLIRDTDPEHLAEQGIPLSPPDLDRLDWEGMKRDLHNLLVDRGLFAWEDVQRMQNGITTSIVSVFKGPVVRLYRSEDSIMED